MPHLINLAILTMGFSGLVAQMLLLRELLIVFSGNELSIGIILANWLILEAFGAFFLGKRAEITKNKIEIFISITIIFCLSLVAAIYCTRILKNILGISIGQGVGILPILYSSFLILLLTSVSHGALFTFGCKICSDFSRDSDTSSIGKVYVYETVGTLVGGIIWTYLLIPYLHSFYIAVGLVALNLLVCVVLIPYCKSGKFQKIITTVCCTFLLLGIFSLFSGLSSKLQHLSIKSQWKGQNVVHYQNSIYGNICVIESGGQYTFFLDGIPHIVVPVPDIVFVEEFVHLPLLSHPDPKKVLILSGGAGGVINEILKHPQVKLVDYVELDTLLLKLLRKFHTKLSEDKLSASVVKIHHIDGRLFLKMTKTVYDIILIGLSEPSDLQTNRFFTKEFFSLCKKKLTKSGILAFTLPGSLTYLSDELRELNGCIFNTLKSEFSFVRAFPGDGYNIFLASNSKEITLVDKDWIIHQLSQRNIKADIIVPRHIEYKLHPRWTDWFSEFMKKSTKKINLDFTPVGVFYSVSYWNAIFTPNLGWIFRMSGNLNLRMFFLLFIILAGLYFLIRAKKGKIFGSGIPFCIATTGFAGMIFDLALIFTFQAVYGYVFYWLGLLVSFFMVGAAIGAAKITSFLPYIKESIKFFIKIELAVICFSVALPFILSFLRPYLDTPQLYLSLRFLFLLLSFISGVLIGAEFPLANKIYLKERTNLSSTVGLLYSSDLLGGWLGGLVGGFVLLSVLGLVGTCVIVVMIKLFSFILITGQSRAYLTI